MEAWPPLLHQLGLASLPGLLSALPQVDRTQLRDPSLDSVSYPWRSRVRLGRGSWQPRGMNPPWLSSRPQLHQAKGSS